VHPAFSKIAAAKIDTRMTSTVRRKSPTAPDGPLMDDFRKLIVL
jgi:hypothetical protein